MPKQPRRTTVTADLQEQLATLDELIAAYQRGKQVRITRSAMLRVIIRLVKRLHNSKDLGGLKVFDE